MTVAVETGTWQLDPAASTVGLRHKTFWGLVTVKGAFATVAGSGEVGPDGSATGTVTLDAASLDTGHTKRDTHLRSADFLDTDNHPEITFAVRGADRLDGDQARIAGQLTVRGVSRPLSVTARLSDATADALTLETEFSVDRDQFGMGWNQLGMMRGLTAVTARLRFTRVQA
ncbi:YceI family protein [Streptomyces durhamensis]|uniref:YceI family protein n=1 Tax=Streptomyces durhamensis TaxID=68194 RepID=UPI0004CDA226|nr:YceI family protein [Streptomyces durhamensis]